MKFAQYTAQNPADILASLQSGQAGLSSTAAHQRLVANGPNQVSSERIRAWALFAQQFTSPFVYLLFGACLLAFGFGEWLDGILIVGFIVINSALGFYQEYKSEKTVELLSRFVTVKTIAVRDGHEQAVDTVDLVVGDVVVLHPGDIVPADIRVVEANDLAVDESVLTGESVAVEKSEQTLETPADAVHKASNILFSGTTLVRGTVKGVVIAVGSDTNYGEIAKLTLQTAKKGIFDQEIKRLSRVTIVLVAVSLVGIFIFHLLFKPAPDLTAIALFSIALAVSVIPEALPVVTTFSLSLGALQLAKSKVVVKRLTAIEDLGAVEVLCCDKTGTLTENHLTVAEVYAIDQKALLVYANLAANYTQQERNVSNVAFESALLAALDESHKQILSTYTFVEEFPFDPVRKRASALVRHETQTELVVRGAPEAIIALSVNVDDAEKSRLASWIAERGVEGKRVLAVGSKAVDDASKDAILAQETGFTFLGLVSFTDPIKPTAADAIQRAENLGVKIKLITGDSKDVAVSVAKAIGLIQDHSQVLEGEAFMALSELDRDQAAAQYAVFARVAPEQKYAIIASLERQFEVGFLGEGINDAPALKIANVALVVDGASDIAREAADIVLLDKSLDVIINGIQEGRRVYANTTKYIIATLSGNFGNFFAIGIVSVFIPFLPMLPLQLLLVNLLSDFPMISVATDTVDEASITKPKRYALKDFAMLAIVLGVVSTLFDFIYFAIFIQTTPQILQTAWFMGSIITELIFLYSIRTRGLFFKAKRPSTPIILLTGVAAAVTVGLPYTPIGQSLFRFTPLSGNHLLVIVGIAACYFLITEVVKLSYFRKFGQQ